MTGRHTSYNRSPFWIIIYCILGFTSCEEQIDRDLIQNELPAIVVDAKLTNEYKYQHIHLTKPFSSQNDEPTNISGALVKVEAGNNFMFFIESPEHPGHYFSPEKISTAVDIDYQLQIQYDDQEYLAETYMIPVLPAAAPQWVFHEDKGLYSIQWPAGAYNPIQQAMYEAIISWDHLVDPSYTDTLTTARIMYYSFNTIDVSYVVFPQEKEEVFFPANSLAIVKKYALTNEYAAYLRALLAETEWQGSLFEDARGNLPSNISNGGLGYFSACSVITDTLIVN